MSNDKYSKIDNLQRLLDYQFNLDSPEERADTEKLLETDNQLNKLNKALERTLNPLWLMEDSVVPNNLTERTIQYIAQHNQAQVMANISAEIVRQRPAPMRRKNNKTASPRDFYVRGSRLGWVLGNFRDLFAVAASVMLVFLLIRPGLHNARQYSRQLQCASNMNRIATAMTDYGRDNDGLIPQVKRKPGTFWLKVPGKNNDNSLPNSRNMYLLVKNGYITPNAFFCPGQQNNGHIPYRFNINRIRAMNDFENNWPVGYSFAMTQSARQRLNDNNMNNNILVADKNPVFERFDPHHPDELNLAEQPSLLNINSYNHNNRGQNILLGNGSVLFIPGRKWGLSHDDIYTIKQIMRYRFNELPKPGDIFAP